jgi:hypothetical protein
MEETMYPHEVLTGIGHYMKEGKRGINYGTNKFKYSFFRIEKDILQY